MSNCQALRNGRCVFSVGDGHVVHVRVPTTVTIKAHGSQGMTLHPYCTVPPWNSQSKYLVVWQELGIISIRRPNSAQLPYTALGAPVYL